MIEHVLLEALLVLGLAGIGLWALSQFPAIDATISKIIRAIVVVAVAIWALYTIVGLLEGHPRL